MLLSSRWISGRSFSVVLSAVYLDNGPFSQWGPRILHHFPSGLSAVLQRVSLGAFPLDAMVEAVSSALIWGNVPSFEETKVCSFLVSSDLWDSLSGSLSGLLVSSRCAVGNDSPVENHHSCARPDPTFAHGSPHQESPSGGYQYSGPPEVRGRRGEYIPPSQLGHPRVA